MVIKEGKGNSPFIPGQPVPVELFRGREEQIRRIMERGVQQTASGKPTCFYIEGEYGIGKSSLARYTQEAAARDYGLHGIYVTLGGTKNLEDVAEQVLIGTIRSGGLDKTKTEKIREWLGELTLSAHLFNITLEADLEKIKKEAPSLNSSTKILIFLQEVIKRLEVSGLFLIFDEINGIAPELAPYLKGIIDSNVLVPNSTPVPFLLMLCGTPEKRKEMIRAYQPVERIFDVVPIDKMTDKETNSFFTAAFESVGMKVKPEALTILTMLSGGFPKIMHIIGDEAFYADSDGVIDENDAITALVHAAEEVGRKYVDQQIFQAIQSKDYKSILDKIVSALNTKFNKKEIERELTETEKKRFSNFLTRMQQLHVIKRSEERGEYVFIMPMVYWYLRLRRGRVVAQ